MIFICGAVILFFSNIAASATTLEDDEEDVALHQTTETTVGWVHVNDKPNIDITQASCIIGTNTTTLSLAVAGAIENENRIVYTVTYSNDDSAHSYRFTYTNDFGYSYYVTPTENGTGNAPAITKSNTLSCTFDEPIGNTTGFELEAVTTQYTILADLDEDYWSDTVIGSISGLDDSDGDGDSGGKDKDEDKGIPGFETIAIIAAIGVTLILLRRKK